MTHIAPTRSVLSEFESNRLLASHGLVIAEHALLATVDDAVAWADGRYPVVAKACASELAHKSDRGLVHVGLMDETQLRDAYDDLVTAFSLGDGILVQRMVSGSREVLIGALRDPVFGPVATLGLGGVYTELLSEVTVAIPPLDDFTVQEMLDRTPLAKLLGAYRGSSPIPLEAVAQALRSVADAICNNPEIQEIDVNPLIAHEGRLVAVDSVVVVATHAPSQEDL